MILRNYRPEDFDALCEIDRLCFPSGIAYTPAEVAVWLWLNGTFALVAEDRTAKRVGGFVLARKTRLRGGRIITIDVLPQYRRKAVGRRLMEAAHARLKRMGATRVRLETSVDNDAALAFYRKLGYQTIGRIPNYYLDRIDAWVLSKDL